MFGDILALLLAEDFMSLRTLNSVIVFLGVKTVNKPESKTGLRF